MNSVGSFAIILECWKAEPEKRPDFSQIVVPISLILEAAAGYMNFSMAVKNGHSVAAKVEAQPGQVVLVYSHQVKRKKPGNRR